MLQEPRSRLRPLVKNGQSEGRGAVLIDRIDQTSCPFLQEPFQEILKSVEGVSAVSAVSARLSPSQLRRALANTRWRFGRLCPPDSQATPMVTRIPPFITGECLGFAQQL